MVPYFSVFSTPRLLSMDVLGISVLFDCPVMSLFDRRDFKIQELTVVFYLFIYTNNLLTLLLLLLRSELKLLYN